MVGSGSRSRTAGPRPVSATIPSTTRTTPTKNPSQGAALTIRCAPALLHYTVDDPRKLPGSVDSLMRSVSAADADAEYIQYPGRGHLFTDPNLPEEFDPAATERFWSRVLAFCATHTTAR
jgi:dienelactone hydrolase